MSNNRRNGALLIAAGSIFGLAAFGREFVALRPFGAVAIPGLGAECVGLAVLLIAIGFAGLDAIFISTLALAELLLGAFLMSVLELRLVPISPDWSRPLLGGGGVLTLVGILSAGWRFTRPFVGPRSKER